MTQKSNPRIFDLEASASEEDESDVGDSFDEEDGTQATPRCATPLPRLESNAEIA